MMPHDHARTVYEHSLFGPWIMAFVRFWGQGLWTSKLMMNSWWMIHWPLVVHSDWVPWCGQETTDTHSLLSQKQLKARSTYIRFSRPLRRLGHRSPGHASWALGVVRSPAIALNWVCRSLRRFGSLRKRRPGEMEWTACGGFSKCGCEEVFLYIIMQLQEMTWNLFIQQRCIVLIIPQQIPCFG